MNLGTVETVRTMRESPVNRLKSHWPEPVARPPVPEYEAESWGELARSWEEHLEEFMGQHPKLTVAAAAAVGLVLGWMVKRK
jgi:hypothetical protein